MRAKVCTTEVNVGTAARILKVSYTTINRLCEEGMLQARRIPPRGWWRIEYDSVIDFASKIRTP